MRLTFVFAGLVAGLAAVAAAMGLFAHDTAPTPTKAIQEAAQHMPPEQTFAPIFEPCAHCHEIGPGARMATGPVLTNVVGRRAGTRPDYPYSEAMRRSGLVWDEATLHRFLANPNAVVPGTRMIFGGLPEEKIDPLIAFLKSAGDGE